MTLTVTWLWSSHSPLSGTKLNYFNRKRNNCCIKLLWGETNSVDPCVNNCLLRRSVVLLLLFSLCYTPIVFIDYTPIVFIVLYSYCFYCVILILFSLCYTHIVFIVLYSYCFYCVILILFLLCYTQIVFIVLYSYCFLVRILCYYFFCIIPLWLYSILLLL